MTINLLMIVNNYPPSSVVVCTQGRESGGFWFETRSGVIPQASSIFNVPLLWEFALQVNTSNLHCFTLFHTEPLSV
jgi:hypothetical protein